MKKLLSTSAICLFTVLGGLAQTVPGFLGKRLAIGYALQLTPNFRHGNYSTSGGPQVNTNGFDELYFAEFSFKPKGISNVHFLQAEYVMSKKISLVGAFSYSRAYYAAPQLFTNYNSLSYDGRPGLNTFAPMLGVRWYTHQLAPVGSFFELNLSYMFINPDDFAYTAERDPSSAGSGPAITSAVITPESSKAFLLGLKFGKSRMVASNLKLDFFCSLGIQFPGMNYSATRIGDISDPDLYGSEDGYFDGNHPLNKDVFTNLAQGRMFGSHWASTGISLNFMP